MKQQQKPKKEFAPLTVVSRDQWGALPPREALTPLQPPYKFLAFTHTQTKECYSNEQCIKIVKEIQTRHMEEEGMPDVQFNWIVGFKGHVYEGRGWDSAPTLTDPRHIRHVGENTQRTILVAYIGTFLDRWPSDEMFNTSSTLLVAPLMKDMYDEDFKFIPHLITKAEKKPKPQAKDKIQDQTPQAAGDRARAAILKKRLKKYDDSAIKKDLFYNIRGQEGENSLEQE